jgi:hypothetical protein
MQSLARSVAGLAALAMAARAQAEVVLKADNGFVVRNAAEVTASPLEAWQAMIDPAKWWSGQHTFSGDAANLTLDPVPGGCFCERLPAANSASTKNLPSGQREGGVQHMRVIYAEPMRAMRLSGALGPLQSEALSGTLTMTLKPVGSGTRILWEYVVGGFMRYKTDEIALAVDKVLAGQLASLAARLGPVAVTEPAAGPAAPAGPAPSKADAARPAIVKPAAVPAKIGRADKWSLPPAGPKTVKAQPAMTTSASAAKPLISGPAAKSVVNPGIRSATKVAAPPPAKPLRKAASKVANAGEKERREAIDAFDAALGKAPEQ